MLLKLIIEVPLRVFILYIVDASWFYVLFLSFLLHNEHYFQLRLWNELEVSFLCCSQIVSIAWISHSLHQDSEENQKSMYESSSSSESENNSVNVTISQVTSTTDGQEDSSSFSKHLEQKGQHQMQEVTAYYLVCDELPMGYEECWE